MLLHPLSSPGRLIVALISEISCASHYKLPCLSNSNNGSLCVPVPHCHPPAAVSTINLSSLHLSTSAFYFPCLLQPSIHPLLSYNCTLPLSTSRSLCPSLLIPLQPTYYFGDHVSPPPSTPSPFLRLLLVLMQGLNLKTLTTIFTHRYYSTNQVPPAVCCLLLSCFMPMPCNS